jgi:hypothetical protein
MVRAIPGNCPDRQTDIVNLIYKMVQQRLSSQFLYPEVHLCDITFANHVDDISPFL